MKKRLAELISEQLQVKLAEQLKEQISMKRRLTEAKNKLEQFELRFVTGEIERTFYEKYKQKFKLEIQDITSQMSHSRINSSNLKKVVN